jgi:hypothetical protein
VRLVVAIATALLIFQASGASSEGGEDDCAQSCPDDDPGGECPPACPSCTCATHAHPPLIPSLAAESFVVESPTVSSLASKSIFVPSPDPREILHVPRALLG